MGKVIIQLARSHSQYPPHEPALWVGIGGLYLMRLLGCLQAREWCSWCIELHSKGCSNPMPHINTISKNHPLKWKLWHQKKNIHTSILQFTSCICHAIRYPWWEVMGRRGGSQWHYLWATACSRKSPFTQIGRIIVAIIKLAHSSKKGSVLWLSFFAWEEQAFNQCETRTILNFFLKNWNQNQNHSSLFLRTSTRGSSYK